jgi:hypothetical protein
MIKKEEKPRLIKLILLLSEFDLEIEDKRGMSKSQRDKIKSDVK